MSPIPPENPGKHLVFLIILPLLLFAALYTLAVYFWFALADQQGMAIAFWFDELGNVSVNGKNTDISS